MVLHLFAPPVKLLQLCWMLHIPDFMKLFCLSAPSISLLLVISSFPFTCHMINKGAHLELKVQLL